MAPASNPKTQRPTVVALLKNTQFWVDLDTASQYPPLDPMNPGTSPVLDYINPAGEEGRAQVSGDEIEDVDDDTTQESTVEHSEWHQWMLSPLHLINDEEE